MCSAFCECQQKNDKSISFFSGHEGPGGQSERGKIAVGKGFTVLFQYLTNHALFSAIWPRPSARSCSRFAGDLARFSQLSNLVLQLF
jgi:hypothetical protein